MMGAHARGVLPAETSHQVIKSSSDQFVTPTAPSRHDPTLGHEPQFENHFTTKPASLATLGKIVNCNSYFQISKNKIGLKCGPHSAEDPLQSPPRDPWVSLEPSLRTQRSRLSHSNLAAYRNMLHVRLRRQPSGKQGRDAQLSKKEKKDCDLNSDAYSISFRERSS